MDYREAGILAYGDKCEICYYGLVEVHHIGYQEHQELENRLRMGARNKQDISHILEEARQKGFLFWNGSQLSKDNRSTNLSVLCGNCHTLIHRMDVGMKLLAVLHPRILI